MNLYRFSGYFCTGLDFDAVDKHLRTLSTRHLHIDKAELPWKDMPEHNCDLADLEKHFVGKQYNPTGRVVVIGGIYKHFKGNIVKVLTVAKYTEDPIRQMVIYECDNGIYARPRDMFLSLVDKEKYPDATQEYRFELVKEAD